MQCKLQTVLTALKTWLCIYPFLHWRLDFSRVLINLYEILLLYALTLLKINFFCVSLSESWESWILVGVHNCIIYRKVRGWINMWLQDSQAWSLKTLAKMVKLLWVLWSEYFGHLQLYLYFLPKQDYCKKESVDIFLVFCSLASQIQGMEKGHNQVKLLHQTAQALQANHLLRIVWVMPKLPRDQLNGKVHFLCLVQVHLVEDQMQNQMLSRVVMQGLRVHQKKTLLPCLGSRNVFLPDTRPDFQRYSTLYMHAVTIIIMCESCYFYLLLLYESYYRNLLNVVIIHLYMYTVQGFPFQ